MKALIIYDSYFGNTEQIAKAIGSTLNLQGSTEVVRIGELKPGQIKGTDLLIVGSPTRAFKPTDAIRVFLKNVSAEDLKGVKVAAFDTRISVEDTKSSVLRVFVKIFGYAAKPIADGLKQKGGNLTLPPEGFIVKDTEGPLKEGELERAADWAKSALR